MVKFVDINKIIIPFLEKYPIIGVKYKDFKDFCQIADMMQNKDHLTPEGLIKISNLKEGMNTGRKGGDLD